jgi:hypothetical protein
MKFKNVEVTKSTISQNKLLNANLPFEEQSPLSNLDSELKFLESFFDRMGSMDNDKFCKNFKESDLENSCPVFPDISLLLDQHSLSKIKKIFQKSQNDVTKIKEIQNKLNKSRISTKNYSSSPIYNELADILSVLYQNGPILEKKFKVILNMIKHLMFLNLCSNMREEKQKFSHNQIQNEFVQTFNELKQLRQSIIPENISKTISKIKLETSEMIKHINEDSLKLKNRIKIFKESFQNKIWFLERDCKHFFPNPKKRCSFETKKNGSELNYLNKNSYEQKFKILVPKIRFRNFGQVQDKKKSQVNTCLNESKNSINNHEKMRTPNHNLMNEKKQGTFPKIDEQIHYSSNLLFPYPKRRRNISLESFSSSQNSLNVNVKVF